MTSAMSYWMYRPASPMAFEPVAHAVATAVFGPVMPKMNRDVAAGGVDHEAGNGERADPAHAAAYSRMLVLLFKRFDARRCRCR